MRTIYLEPISFECKTVQNKEGTRIPFETDFFDGKCDAFIEGYRIVPSDEIWTREDGTVFRGEMISPWKPYSELDSAQREYERALIVDMQNALNKLGVTLDE